MNFMLMGLEDMITFILFIISIVVVIGAQAYIGKAFKEYRTTKIKRNMTGFEVARRILDHNGLSKVHIVEVKGELSDHYDPTQKVVRLSTPIFHESSVASVAVAAHEVGHALQDKDNYIYLKIRAALVPVVSLISYLGYFAILVAIFAGITQYLMIGILILLATLVFQIVTLPVEFNASKRANQQLLELGLIDVSEKENVKGMLNAAALTYVAALVATLLQIVRLFLMTRRR